MLSIIVLGIIIDLVSKVLFANYFEGGGRTITVIPNFFYFTFVKNTGAAFGIFGDSTLGLIISSIIFIGFFIAYDIFYHSNNIWYTLGMSMLLSGAIGNLVDRIFLGYVRDFISIELFSFIFNFADTLITFGIIFFGVYLVFYGFKDDKKKVKVSYENVSSVETKVDDVIKTAEVKSEENIDTKDGEK